MLLSFDAYYGAFEGGGGSTGQALVGLSEDIRCAVREEAPRYLGDAAGPVKPEAEYRIASGGRGGNVGKAALRNQANGRFRRRAVGQNPS